MIEFVAVDTDTNIHEETFSGVETGLGTIGITLLFEYHVGRGAAWIKRKRLLRYFQVRT